MGVEKENLRQESEDTKGEEFFLVFFFLLLLILGPFIMDLVRFSHWLWTGWRWGAVYDPEQRSIIILTYTIRCKIKMTKLK